MLCGCALPDQGTISLFGAVEEKGLLGAFTGGLTAAAGGIAASILFGYFFVLVCKPHEKS